MGILQNENAIPVASAGGFYDYQIEQSIRMDADNSEHLRRTPSSAGNRQTWSFSFWAKRGTLGSFQIILEAGSSGDASTRLFHAFKSSDDGIEVSSGTVNYGASSAKLRDTSGWNHIFIKHTGGTQTIYLNGNSIKTSSISGDTAVNSTVAHGIGCRASGTGDFYNGYMAEVILVDGTAYEPTQFAESKNGVWIPKDPSGTSFGTNGVHLKFENASDLGNDSSGNNNDFTATNMGTDHQVLDSPTFGS
tara:strand:+ start:160 stop:903 length:744 start_codon:yes stop_codon:yes gene_type:complete